ncbi:hypothetical protein [uncultured Serinicoccus sp.]|uniref:MFS transporter small subunit n=1 Tax=uncultured Serinicoccus sp. TaxID=735514 RepID=UPI002617D5A9|nr:hypothetical protein [uncultured Serinicoccus sp.]
MSDSPSSTAERPEGADAAGRTAAVVLWVIVSAGLLYGIGETVARVTQLFG